MIPPISSPRPPKPCVVRSNTAILPIVSGGGKQNPSNSRLTPSRVNGQPSTIPLAATTSPTRSNVGSMSTASLPKEHAGIKPNPPTTLPKPATDYGQPITRLSLVETASQTDRMDLVTNSTPITTDFNTVNRDPWSMSDWSVIPPSGRPTTASAYSVGWSTSSSPNSTPTAPEFSVPTPVKKSRSNKHEEQVSSFFSGIFDSPPSSAPCGMTVFTSLDSIVTDIVPSPSIRDDLVCSPNVSLGPDPRVTHSLPVSSSSPNLLRESPLSQRASKKVKDKR